MNISYDYYRVFYYVARYKSFTGAANALFNNQPNITRMMKKLEEELGCKLFVRQRHGVALTPEGEKLYAHTAAAFEHIALGEREIAGYKSLRSGTVSIASSEIALHCALLPALKSFRGAYPGVRVRISNTSTPQAIEMLKKGMVDIAVVTEPYEPSAGMTSKILRSIQEIPVCSGAFAMLTGTTLAAKQLASYPLIGFTENTGSFRFYSDFFNKMGISYSPEIQVATSDQILPVVKSDLGIGFVPTDYLGKEGVENLMILNINPSIPTRNICIVKRTDGPLGIASAKLEELIISVSRDLGGERAI